MNLARAVSLFTDFLEFDIGIADIEEIEPEEIRALCNDPVFRKIAEYCKRSRQTEHPQHEKPCQDETDRFSRAEMGVDPEEDVECPS